MKRSVKGPIVLTLVWPVLSEVEGPEVAEVYPHVAKLSGGVATDHPRERVRQKVGAGN